MYEQLLQMIEFGLGNRGRIDWRYADRTQIGECAVISEEGHA